MSATTTATKPRADDATAPRARPAWLRALGNNDPPQSVTVDGDEYQCAEIFKHDSWAATAVYESDSAKIICKFNRRQSLLGLPGAWIGRLLARREANFLARLSDVPGVPRVLGPVFIDGREARNAVARRYIAGRALNARDRVTDDFFTQLAEILRLLHERNIAYVDLHKRENVLIGADSLPYLIDYQVSFGPSSNTSRPSFFGRALLSALQKMDWYNFTKLHRKCRPDQCRLSADELAALRPRLVRIHRFFAEPLRNARRRLLTWLGVRSGRGRVESEQFAEAALRDEQKLAA